jgi:hypothetical protein
MSTSSPTQSAMYHRVEFWKIVVLAGLCFRVRSIWSTLLNCSPLSVLPICFVAADSDAPAPTAIEISATSVSATARDEGSVRLFGMDIEPVADGCCWTSGVAYRPTSRKILKLSRSVRQASHVPRPIGAPQQKGYRSRSTSATSPSVRLLAGNLS